MQVATISANGDVTIGKLIADGMKRVGRDGVLTVKDGHAVEDSLEVRLQLHSQCDADCARARLWRASSSTAASSRHSLSTTPRVCDSPNRTFAADPALAARRVEYQNALVLLADKKISNIQSIVPALELAIQEKKSAAPLEIPVPHTPRPLVIVAEDIDNEALSALVYNRIRSQLQVTRNGPALLMCSPHPDCRCQGPWLWRQPQEHAAGTEPIQQRHSLTCAQDLAIATGGYVFGAEGNDVNLEDCTSKLEILAPVDSSQ